MHIYTLLQSVETTLVTTTECRRTDILEIKTIIQRLFPSVHISDDESVSHIFV